MFAYVIKHKVGMIIVVESESLGFGVEKVVITAVEEARNLFKCSA